MLKKLNQSDYKLKIVKDLGMKPMGGYRSDTGKPRNQRKAVFMCSCGVPFTALTDQVRSGKHKSCGCLLKTNPGALKHGDSGTRLYSIWKAYIKVSGKVYYLGHHLTAEEAGKAYDKYVIENKLEHTINGV